jgi:hypothetical protein
MRSVDHDLLECNRRCEERRGEIYKRLSALEVEMAKVGLKTAFLIAIAAFVGTTAAAPVVAAIITAALK